jgi:MFS family permease
VGQKNKTSAILSDITTPANRAKALSHVGIAFAICFCIGPPIGAYFASRPVPLGQTLFGTQLNVYAAPAILTLVLLVAETAFLAIALPETRGKSHRVQSSEKRGGDGRSSNRLGRNDGKDGNDKHVEQDSEVLARPAEQRIKMLKSLRVLHFLFLGIFSGVEFTLTFLTFDRT